jgi:hypothetical protein
METSQRPFAFRPVPDFRDKLGSLTLVRTAKTGAAGVIVHVHVKHAYVTIERQL